MSFDRIVCDLLHRAGLFKAFDVVLGVLSLGSVQIRVKVQIALHHAPNIVWPDGTHYLIGWYGRGGLL
jgi:hypothetical protein